MHLCGMGQVDPRINVTVAAWDLRFLVGHGRNGFWYDLLAFVSCTHTHAVSKR